MSKDAQAETREEEEWPDFQSYFAEKAVEGVLAHENALRAEGAADQMEKVRSGDVLCDACGSPYLCCCAEGPTEDQIRAEGAAAERERILEALRRQEAKLPGSDADYVQGWRDATAFVKCIDSPTVQEAVAKARGSNLPPSRPIGFANPNSPWPTLSEDPGA